MTEPKLVSLFLVEAVDEEESIETATTLRLVIEGAPHVIETIGEIALVLCEQYGLAVVAHKFYDEQGEQMELFPEDDYLLSTGDDPE